MYHSNQQGTVPKIPYFSENLSAKAVPIIVSMIPQGTELKLAHFSEILSVQTIPYTPEPWGT